MDLRLLLPAAGSWFLAALTLTVGVNAGAIVFGLLSIGGVFFAVLFPERRLLGNLVFAFLCIGLVFGATSVQLLTHHRNSIENQIDAVTTAEFQMNITGYCRLSTFQSLQCPVFVESHRTEPDEDWVSVSIRARAVFQLGELPRQIQESSELVIGQRMVVRARAERLAHLGQEPYRLRVQQIVQEFPVDDLNAVLNPIRHMLTQTSAQMPGTGAELLPGVAIGETILVSDQLDEAMKVTSLSHLTAVSGSNFAMVVMVFLVLGGRFGLSRLTRSVLALGGLIGFMLLVTSEPSVLRASLMAMLVLLAENLGRKGSASSTLALSVVLLLLFDPWLAIAIGFVLSVSATAGLIFLAAPLAERLSAVMPHPVALALAVPLAAQLACQPALLVVQEGIPTYGVIANMLVSLASPLATGLALLAGVLMPAFPLLGEWILWLAWLPSSWIAWIAEFFSSLPYARFIWLEGVWGIVCAILVLILVVLWIVLGSTQQAGRFIQGIGLCLALGFAALWGTATGSQMTPQNWQVAFCDIGQGDALLLRSEEQIALIDTGPDPALLTACLSRLGISAIDILFLSHFDHDHSGGLEALAEVPIRQVLYSSIHDADRERLSVLGRASQYHAAQAGMSGKLGSSTWRVLWPLPDTLRFDQNQSSLVLAFDGVLSLLSLGDLGEQSQRDLMLAYGNLKADILKVAHHGSADQYPELYERIDPRAAVFTVGENSYGHPHPDTLALFSHQPVFRTDERGMILFSVLPAASGKGDLKVWTEH